MLCTSKFLEMVLEAQGCFPFNSQPRQGALQALKVPYHTHLSRQQEGYPMLDRETRKAFHLKLCSAHRSMTVFVSWMSWHRHHQPSAALASTQAQMPSFVSNPHPEWGAAGSWLVLTSAEHSVLSVAQPRSCAAPPHPHSCQRNASNDPMLCTQVHLRQCCLPRAAWSKKQLNCFQGPPTTFYSQADTNLWWVPSIWIKLELEPSKSWAAPGDSTSTWEFAIKCSSSSAVQRGTSDYESWWKQIHTTGPAQTLLFPLHSSVDSERLKSSAHIFLSGSYERST